MEVFDYTYVEYAPNPFGKYLAIITLSPVFIIVGLTALILFSRLKKRNLFLLAGLVGTEISSKFLKHSIKQPRPARNGESLHDLGMPTSSYGMPSAHSQFMAFFSTYLILYILNKPKFFVINKLLAVCVLISWASAIAYSRIYHEYHTVVQVGVGLALGIVSGFVYHALVRNICCSFKKFKFFKKE